MQEMTKANKSLYSKEFYEPGDLQDHELTDLERLRISATLKLVPRDIESIMDVGCGDGRLINILAGKFKTTVGVEISESLLTKVQTRTICCSCSDIPVEDSSFDLVMCNEVLEHLPSDLYAETISELQRISRRYILVTVPYRENLRMRYARCAQCNHVFHAWHHLRTFKRSDLERDFGGAYEPVTWVTFGNKEKRLNSSLLRISQNWGNQWFRQEKLSCGNCGGRNAASSSNANLAGRIVNRLNKLISLRSYHYWQGLLLEKRQ